MIKTRSREEWIKIGNDAVADRKMRIEAARKWKFDTIATHGIYDMEHAMNTNNGSIIEPIYMSSAQTWADSNELEACLSYEIPGWIYSRIANPTLFYLEDTIALMEAYGTDLETSTLVTSSGMSAIFSTIQPFLVKDDSLPPPNLVVQAKCYGGTFQLFGERMNKEWGIEVRWVKNPCDIKEWEEKIDEGTRFIYGEFPSNPGVEIFDISELSKLADKHNVTLIVDATCASPAITRPLQFGADIVIQSATKIIASSGGSIIGVITSKNNIRSRVGNAEMKKDFVNYLKGYPFRDYGPCAHPMGAYVTLTDLRTLRMRAAHMCRGAMKIAEYLESNSNVAKVHYPGLESYKHHDIAKKYMKLADSNENLYGYLMSFDIAESKPGEIKNTRKFFDALQLIWRATDLGRVKTICTLPAISTHQQMGEESRDLADILPNCARLSVGIENPDDLIADLDQALKKF